MNQLKAKGKAADPGAIYNKAIEENWGAELAVKKEAEQKERAAKDKKAAEARAKKVAAERERLIEEFIRLKTKELITGLSKPDLLEMVHAYLESAPEKARFFREDTCTFSTPVERIAFTGWLNTTLKYVFREAEFDAWLESKKPAAKGAVA
jgi:hypothetical protein